ncbi:MAG: hypothetical protein ACYYKD_04335 [Rhodospirillales bacterium]
MSVKQNTPGFERLRRTVFDEWTHPFDDEAAYTAELKGCWFIIAEEMTKKGLSVSDPAYECRSYQNHEEELRAEIVKTARAADGEDLTAFEIYMSAELRKVPAEIWEIVNA